MSSPSVISVSPNPNQTEVVLGAQIIVTFDQPIDTTTVTPATFSLTGPGQTQFVSPTELNSRSPKPAVGREYIPGTFTFSTNSDGNTVVTFSPTRPLRPDVVYTVLLVGPGSALSESIKNLESPPDTLDSNYQWTFTTGDLDISIPPVTSPLPPLLIPLDPSKVKIEQQIWAVGNDLSQEIDIIFPAPINTNTITPEQVLLSLEAILNDPSVTIPTGLTPTVKIAGSTISIIISGWPAS